MSKKKKIIIAAVCAACAVLIALGAFLAIALFKDKKYEYTVNDTLPDGNGQRATVILLGGQSNASGCSRDDYLQMKVSEDKYAQYAEGYDNVYINYISGFTKASGGFVKCATLQGELDGGFGPELGLAEKLSELYPDRTFFIIKCAWGGTNLFEQWRAPSSSGKTGDLYLRFADFVEANVEYLESKNYDVDIEAMCWMQGESDSFGVDNGNDYRQNLTDLIGDIRERFEDHSSDDGIAFVDAEIADNPVYWVYCELVNESKRAVADQSPINVLIDTNAAGLSCDEEPEDNPDRAHYDALSEIKLGHLFAEAAADFFD